MKIRFNFGTAVVLVALFLINPIAGCAAMWQRAAATTHACCPREAQPSTTTTGSDCCMVSAPPVSPVLVNDVEPHLWGALPNNVQPAMSSAESEYNDFGIQRFQPSHLFLRFRQLLI
jgi:hypothetical protein